MRYLSLVLAAAALFVSEAAYAQAWDEYANREDFFSVNFPGEPTKQEFTYKTAKGTSLPAHTYTAQDSRGGTATGSTTLQVVRRQTIIFEDVHFDFDRSTLKPEAVQILDEAVTKLQANPGKNLIIEGHTCNIGTAEYNLALGERRARSVVDYLSSRGVSASRLEIRSYGEERPDRKSTRLNSRHRT